MLKFFNYPNLLLLLLFINLTTMESAGFNAEKTKQKTPEKSSECDQLYEEMELDSVVNYTAFRYAFLGYNKIDVRNKDIMTLIDFSKPSTEKRFFVLDMQNKKLLYSTHVSHGKRSGENYATSFSNKPRSHKSSPGFYITENTYKGRNGYSLIINGLEKGINDRAKERSIVIHGADYCDTSLIDEGGRLGRSFGCPALPVDICGPIIDTIKDGTLLYIYVDNTDYLRKSRILATNR